MKREISDLLDGYRDDSVELAGDAPLSTDRIKELTMKRLEEHHRTDSVEHPRRPRRSLTRGLLIAAAVACLCGLTAFAVVRTLRDAARADMGISKEASI